MRDVHIALGHDRHYSPSNAFRLRLDRQSSLLPRFPPADERTGVGPPCLLQLLRHTGAGIFMRSRTVGDKPGWVRKAKGCRFTGGALGRYTDGVTSLQGTRFIVPLGADIKKSHRDIPLPELV
jgi:hypothetical protein